MTKISGNTFPVKEQLKTLGGKWNVVDKCWMVPDEKAQEAVQIVTAGIPAGTTTSTSKPFHYYKCQVCGVKADRYTRIYRSGECRDCYEERKMGY